MVHSSADGYGENLAYNSGSSLDEYPDCSDWTSFGYGIMKSGVSTAMSGWYDEVKDLNPS